MADQEIQRVFVSHASSSVDSGYLDTFFNAIAQLEEQWPAVEFTYYRREEEEEPIDTQETIWQADIVIAEVSVPSTGSGIELGWAHATGTRIVAFHGGEAEPSPLVQFVTDEIYTYVTEDHVLEELHKLP